MWALGVMKGSNTVAMGFDEGVVAIKIGGLRGGRGQGQGDSNAQGIFSAAA